MVDRECSQATDCGSHASCVAGRCVDSDAGSGTKPTHPGSADAAPAPYVRSEFRIGEGPTTAPKVVWEHDLGSVIFADPVIVSHTEGAAGALEPGAGEDPVAYVGTHAGRFVGVIVDGPKAGTVVLDRTVEGIIWRRAAWDEGGRLYFGADNDQLYAMDLGTGDIAWSKRLGNCTPPRAPGPEGVRCDVDGGPTIGPDGDLYVGADGLYRISPEGEIRWRVPASSDVKYAAHVYSIPLVTEAGLVVFGGYDGTLAAVSSGDGTPQWSVSVGADVDGSPVQGPDGTIYVGADDGKLYAIATDGAVQWTFDTGKGIRSAVAVGAEGGLSVPSLDGNVYRVDPTGVAQWVLPAGGPVMATPRLDRRGNLFVGSRDDRLFAVSPAGTVLWNVQFPSDIDAAVAISPEGTLVVGSDDGVLRALR